MFALPADIIEDMYSPRTAAINFVAELVRKRGADNLPKLITFIVNIFTRWGQLSQCSIVREGCIGTEREF
jgi:hypothetical protein